MDSHKVHTNGVAGKISSLINLRTIYTGPLKNSVIPVLRTVYGPLINTNVVVQNTWLHQSEDHIHTGPLKNSVNTCSTHGVWSSH
jgi:hypothetical protein